MTCNSDINDSTEPTEFEAVRALLIGAAPEKKSQIENLFARYRPEFSIVGEVSNRDHGSWVMESGNYRTVRFNNRALRTFWLGCYVVWHCYSELARAIDEGRQFDPSAPSEKLQYLKKMLESEDSLKASWPIDVPEPRQFERERHTSEDAAPGELAMVAVAWAMLHEFRHIQAQQEGWSSTHESREKKHQEEFECDRYAAEFLMESIEAYCAKSNDSEDSVRLKRALGIMFGILVVGIMVPELASATETHPAVCDRVEQLKKLTILDDCEKTKTIFSCAVYALNIVDSDGGKPHV